MIRDVGCVRTEHHHYLVNCAELHSIDQVRQRVMRIVNSADRLFMIAHQIYNCLNAPLCHLRLWASSSIGSIFEINKIVW